MKPEISVCMPAFNQSRYIGLALESVRTQSRSDFEVIVMDDGSTDGTREAVVRVGDPRVRYFRHRKQIVVGKNRNACL
ncbi:MAG: glycosyltransferase, partial [Dehalococcoidia bacterium]|nr:glycosyltransferase [Dehalococcoidia bacterium]